MTLATATSRYLFDLDFDAQDRAEKEETVPTISVYEHEAEMAALERKIRAQAHQAGREEAIAEGSRALADEAEKLTAVAQRLLKSLDEEIGLREERAVRIAVSAAKKLARNLLMAEPAEEIELLFQACLAPMFDASHLVVRMHAAHVELVRERIETIAKTQGFEGRLVFMGEEDLAPGDAHIEWADGGLARNITAIEDSLDTLIADYLSARSGQSPAPVDSEQNQAMKASMEGAFHE